MFAEKNTNQKSKKLWKKSAMGVGKNLWILKQITHAIATASRNALRQYTPPHGDVVIFYLVFFCHRGFISHRGDICFARRPPAPIPSNEKYGTTILKTVTRYNKFKNFEKLMRGTSSISNILKIFRW